MALGLNAALLAVLLPWLRREWRCLSGPWRWALGLGLTLRLAVGGVRGINPFWDAAYFGDLGQLLNAQFWADPAGAWQSLTGDAVRFAGQQIVFYGMSNTLFMGKIIFVLDLASLGVSWMNGLYLSLWAFAGCWRLARVLAQVLPATPAGAGVVGLMLWPSTIYWAVGLSKEAVLLGSATWLTALVVARLYGPPVVRNWRRTLGWWGGATGLALMHFDMRYFFAAPLLGGLLGLALVQGLRRRGWARRHLAQVLVLGAVLGAGAWLAPQVSGAFRLNKLTSQVIRIYDLNLFMSVGRPHFEYPDLRPTAASFLAHTPQAAWNTLTRPWLGESARPQYVLAGLENALLLALLAVALTALARGRGGRLPFALAVVLVGYCLLLTVLIGLSTPNLGTLSRYRSVLLPFWLLLLLQNDYAAAALRRLGLGQGAPRGPANDRPPGPLA